MEYVESTLRSMIRIIDSNHVTLGSGFLAHESGLLVTCSHVVQKIEEQGQNDPPQSISFVFHLYPDHVHQAQVMYPDCWLPYGQGDVAILKFHGILPEGIEFALLDSPSGLEGVVVHAFGYPLSGHTIRYARRVVIGGPTNVEGHREALHLSNANSITTGYSGGPIWDKRGQRVLGILSSIARTDQYGRGEDDAFAIPSTVLRFCGALTIEPLPCYQGLEVFDESDADFFHGRTNLVNDLVYKLRTNSDFLAILGSSGSGKSSVVRAGLIPALRKERLLSLHENPQLPIIITPGHDPLANLMEELEIKSDNLIEAVREYVDQQNLSRFVLFVDQFEELFNMTPSSVCSDFLEKLTELINSDIKTTIILTIRDDFAQRVNESASPEFSSLFRNNQYPISPILTNFEVRSMIVDPLVGTEDDESRYFEDGLIQTIIDDLVKESDLQNGQIRSTLLPLLESTLKRLWEGRNGIRMTHARYNTIEGIKGSLADWAEKVFDSLDKDRQHITRKIFLQLVSVDVVEYQDNSRPKDTRKPCSLSQLSQSTNYKSHVNTVIYEFTKNRLLVTRKDPSSDEYVVDVIHEVLLREWARFKAWIDEDRNRIRWTQSVNERANHWRAKEGDLMGRRDLSKFLPGYKSYVGSWASMFIGGYDPEYTNLTTFIRRSVLRALMPYFAFGGIIVMSLFVVIGMNILEEQAKIRARNTMVIIADAPVSVLQADDMTLEVGPFALDIIEVTNAQYQECVLWGGCVEQDEYGGSNDDPVTYVSAFQAHHFCNWIERRLPSSIEWSYTTLISTPEYRNLITIGQDIPPSEDVDGLLNQIGEWSGTINSSQVDWDGTVAVDIRMLGLGYDSDLPTLEDIITGIGTPPSFTQPNISFRCATTIAI